MSTTLDNIHPGEILLEEFLRPLGISQYRLGVACGIPHSRVTAIIKGRQGITAETAMRLSCALETTPDFWLNLQHDYDLEEVRRKKGDEIKKTVSRLTAA